MKRKSTKTRGSLPSATSPDQAPSIPPDVMRFFAEQGRRGGRSKSPEKIQAALSNIEKANEARWGKSFRGRIAKRARPKP